MKYRKDKFEVGDIVTWDPDRVSDGHWIIENCGKGPFKITRVVNRPYEGPRYDDEISQSNWESMGHTQHVWISDDPNNFLSGAWFRKAL